MDHWLPILWKHSLLAQCHPDQFTAVVDWVPLYTPDGLEKHLPAAPSTFMNAGPPILTAVVPPEFCVGMDMEFLLTNFHWHECLVRQSISIGGRCRQLAFCPYCGVINENSKTTLSHMRKHLDLLFVCGGCYSKSFPHWQALNKHMRTQCHSMLAIREKTRGLQEVGLLVGPVQTTQGSRELSLETSICLDADSSLEAEPLTTTYLLLLSYSRW